MSVSVISRPQACPADHTQASVLSDLSNSMTPRSCSLADIISSLQANSNLSLSQQREMISALRAVARFLDTDPAAIPADPRHLRNRLAALSPASFRISRGRWNNIRSLTLAALRQCGVRTMQGRARAPLAPAWEALRARLPDAETRFGLSRFMSFCCAQQLAPEAVEAAHFTAFRQALDTDSLVRQPHTVHRTACVLWNRAAQTVAGWPDLIVAVPSASRRYALEWTSFPNSFRSDAEAFLNRLGNQDPFADDYAPSTKPSTVHMRRKQILQLATALAASDFPIHDITGLAVLAEVANAKLALRFFLDRTGDKITKYLHQHALLLKTIARHWIKAPPAQVEVLSAICRRLAPKHTGMTDKNRERLLQFDSPANIRTLINLSSRVLREVRHADSGGRRDALRVMFALAVELLVAAPLRIDNLTGLEIDRHFKRVRSGATSTVHLIIPAAETKNGAPYEKALPREAATTLAGYLDLYHRRLSAGPSQWLFPNDDGMRRSTTSFATMLCRFVLRETGIRMNAHLFRHLAAKPHLGAHPEDIETARLTLGHKSSATTRRFYAEMKSAAAFRRYDDVVQSWREQAVPVRQRAQKPTGGRS
jgi:integrase